MHEWRGQRREGITPRPPFDSNRMSNSMTDTHTQPTTPEDRAEDQAIEALIASIQAKIDAAVAARKTTTREIIAAIRRREGVSNG